MRVLFFLFLFVTQAWAQDLYTIEEKSIKGEPFKMSELKNKVILIVNIASQCGYTSQLSELESLYKKYQKQNFVVLGVPTNDFGGQTPENDQGMLEFCQKNYQVTFPILTKKTIQGKDKRELYRLLTEKTPKDLRGEVKWNFEKFLINKKGEVFKRFSSSVKPNDKDLVNAIEALL